MPGRAAGVVFAVVLCAVSFAPGAASAATASATRVKSVEVFTVHGRTSADVTVVYPDAGARKVSRRAVNRGTVRVVVRSADGRVLARRSSSARLPVDVPRATWVQQTYRFALPTTVAAATDPTVDVVAGSQLDPDGPGPKASWHDTDSDRSQPDVDSLDEAPVVYQYHRVSVSARCLLTIADLCGVRFPTRGDPSVDAPFLQPPNDSNLGGRMEVDPPDRRPRPLVRITETVTPDHSYVEGYVAGKDPMAGWVRFVVTDASVPTWGPGKGTTGDEPRAFPGDPGAPLRLTSAGSGYNLTGYIGYRG
jgi:hypothetical protein